MSKFHPVQWGTRHALNYAKFPPEVTGKAYEVYHALYPGQTLERLNERGGLGVMEIIAFLYAHTYPPQEWARRVDQALRKEGAELPERNLGNVANKPE